MWMHKGSLCMQCDIIYIDVVHLYCCPFMYDFSTSFVLCIWIYGNKNDDDKDLKLSFEPHLHCKKNEKELRMFSEYKQCDSWTNCPRHPPRIYNDYFCSNILPKRNEQQG
jgi:hypothetical protein